MTTSSFTVRFLFSKKYALLALLQPKSEKIFCMQCIKYCLDLQSGHLTMQMIYQPHRDLTNLVSASGI